MLEKKPYHLSFTAYLIDIPMLSDLASPANEARQRLDLVDFKVLPNNVLVPQAFVNRASKTVVSYSFLPGPQKGYYLIKMSGEPAEFHAESSNVEMLPEEEDEFVEITIPTLSTFDLDTSSQQPASRSCKGKERMVGTSILPVAKSAIAASKLATVVAKSSIAKLVSKAPLSTTSTGGASGTTFSSDPDYQGLLSTADKPSLLSRLNVKKSTFGVSTVNTQKQEEEEQEEEDTIGHLKHVRTQDTTSTTAIARQPKKEE